MQKFKLAVAVVSATLTTHAIAATAPEPLDLRQTYSGVSSVDVAHIATYNSYANGPGISNSFAISAGAFSFDDPFLKSSANPPLLTAFFGVSPDVPGTTAVDDGGPHLVLGVGSAFAAGLVSGGQDFSQIFTGYTEGSLINDLVLLDTSNLDETDPGYAAQQQTKNAAYSELFSFGGDLNNRLGTTPAFGGPLSLLSFSSATPVGSAVATYKLLSSDVPEPASWAMMIAGFSAIGAAMRRRKVAVRCA